MEELEKTEGGDNAGADGEKGEPGAGDARASRSAGWLCLRYNSHVFSPSS